MAPKGGKRFLLTSRVFFLENYSESVAFGQKLRHFTDQNGTKGDHMKMNFEYFQIQKLILQTVRLEKVDEKMGLFV